MTWLSDPTLSHLHDIGDWPDFTGTKYEILDRLGHGGMAAVYLAQDGDLQRRVAIKVLHAAVTDPLVQKRMLMEARIIARLEHPGILPVHDLGFLSDGRVYYAMKLVKGRRLDEFIDETISLPDSLRLFLRLCDAVAFAHSQGVIHRDLKPANIMIGDFGEVLVIDWGLAKILPHRRVGDIESPQEASTHLNRSAAENETQHGAVLGTPGYMAPEQEFGQPAAIDERTDVYGLGMLLRRLLSGNPPKSIRAVADKATAQTPAARYLTVDDLSRDVNCFLNGERVAAFPERPWETGRRLVARHRTFVILIGTYLALRAVLLLVAR